MKRVAVKIRPGPFFIALLLSLTSSSIACASRNINAQDVKAAPQPKSSSSSGDDSSTPTGWKRYIFDKPLAFSLMLPGEPERRVSTFPGKTETAHVFISESSSGVYGVTYISDLPAVARSWEGAGNELLYDIFIKDFATKIEKKAGSSPDFASQVKFSSERQVTLSDMESLERNFSAGDFRGRMQLVRVGQAGFCVVALWKQAAPPAEQDAFFNSVKITGAGS
jgi:hypothetical protein